MAQRAAAEAFAPGTEQRDVRPIDLVHLAGQCLGDENLEIEILRMYDATVATYLERLRLALTVDDLLLNLHSIKGASSGVGAFAVADLAKDLETELLAHRPIAPERIDDLGMAVEEVRGYIATLLARQPIEP